MQKWNVLAAARDGEILDHLCAMISADPSLRLEARCGDAQEALRLAALARPDVVALDTDWQNGGQELIRRIRASGARVVAVSRTALDALPALDAGASDFCLAPVGGSFSDFEFFAADALDRIKSALQAGAVAAPPEPSGQRPALVALACSAGGPVPLAYVLKRLPQGGPPVLAVQKNSKLFSADFAKLLEKMAGRTVQTAKDGMPLVPGSVTLAGCDAALAVKTTLSGGLILKLKKKASKNPFDDFFLSMGKSLGGLAAGALLSDAADGGKGLQSMALRGAPALLLNKNAILREAGSQARAGVPEMTLEDAAQVIAGWASQPPELSSAATRS